MSPRKSDAKAKLLQATSALMQKQGYAATGLEQIVQESQAPKGSMYYHFPEGKEQLAAEALLLSGAQYTQMIQSILQGPNLQENFRHILGLFEQQLVQSQYTLGCPIASVATTLQPEQHKLQQACQTVFQDWTRLLEEALTAHQLPAAFATVLLSSLEGALLLSRAQQSVAPLKTTGEALIQMLEVHHAQNR